MELTQHMPKFLGDLLGQHLSYAPPLQVLYVRSSAPGVCSGAYELAADQVNDMPAWTTIAKDAVIGSGSGDDADGKKMEFCIRHRRGDGSLEKAH